MKITGTQCYRHEVIIETDPHIMTEAADSGTSVSESVSSDTTVSKNTRDVNSNDMQNYKNNSSADGVRMFSILEDEESTDNPKITLQDIKVLRSIGPKSINQFSSEDLKKSEAWAKKFYKELGTKSPFFRAWFGDWRAHELNPAEIVSFAYGEKNKINSQK